MAWVPSQGFALLIVHFNGDRCRFICFISHDLQKFNSGASRDISINGEHALRFNIFTVHINGLDMNTVLALIIVGHVSNKSK